jgi:hypothetical protein
MCPIEDATLHLGKLAKEQQKPDGYMRDVRHRDQKERVVSSNIT